MTQTLTAGLDALTGWRRELARCLDEIGGFLAERGLIDAPAQTQLRVFRNRVGAEKLIGAFVGALGRSRPVVLNKIDAWLDPLAVPGQADAQFDSQCRDAAHPPGAPLPQRRQVLEGLVLDSARQLEQQVERRLGGQRRQLAEQLVELRGLRGKSGARVAGLLQRADLETLAFEQCSARLVALRLVHARMLNDALAPLACARLRDELERMQAQIRASPLNLGARKAFGALCLRLRGALEEAHQHSDEIGAMLGASFARLNADFGFSLALTPAAPFRRCTDELDLIERNYLKFLGLGHALRLVQPKFKAQFQRLLMSRLGTVFAAASADLESWSRAHSAQLDAQLHECSSTFRQRRESLQRMQTAAGDLDQRLGEIEAHDARLKGDAGRTQALFAALRDQASAALPTSPSALGPPARRATDEAPGRRKDD